MAVLVDNMRTADAAGKVTETPLTEEQIGRVTALVKDAVGFDEKRGDSVSVVNQGFHPEAAPEVPEMDKVPIWENPMIRDIAKLVTGLVVVALMLLFVVRPLIKNLTDNSRTIVGGLPPGAGGAAEGQPGAAAIAAPAGPAGAIAYEQQIAQARGIVAKDPARVAQVVKEWVQNE